MVIMWRTPAPPSASVRRYTGISVALACSLALIAPVSAVSALQGADPDPHQQKRKVDSQIDQLREDLSETNATLATAYTLLQGTQAQLPIAQAALAQAQGAAARAETANAMAAQELEVAQANETKAQDELASTSKQIRESRGEVAQFAAQIYQEQGFGEFDMAMTSTTPQQFADRIALIGTVMDLQGQSMVALATARASQTAQEDRLSALRADSEQAKRKAEDSLAAANNARDKATAAKTALDTLARQRTRQAAAVQAQSVAEQARIAQMQVESARLSTVIKARAAAALRAAKIAAAANRRAKAAAAARAARNNKPSGGGGGGATTSNPPSSGGPLSPPTTVGWISSEYGRRFHPIQHVWRLHSGRDYAAPCGTPVHAAAGGVVIEAGYNSGYGNRVVVDHGVINGVHLTTTYNHMQRLAVGGGRVQRGTVLGYEGSTGNSNGCHIHFEVYEDGTFVDPRNYL